MDCNGWFYDHPLQSPLFLGLPSLELLKKRPISWSIETAEFESNCLFGVVKNLKAYTAKQSKGVWSGNTTTTHCNPSTAPLGSARAHKRSPDIRKTIKVIISEIIHGTEPTEQLVFGGLCVSIASWINDVIRLKFYFTVRESEWPLIYFSFSNLSASSLMDS